MRYTYFMSVVAFRYTRRVLWSRASQQIPNEIGMDNLIRSCVAGYNRAVITKFGNM